jgi:ATP-dependent protease ClpP protease subunit
MPTHPIHKNKNNITSVAAPARAVRFSVRPERTIEWLGGVTYDNLGRMIGAIKQMMIADPKEEVALIVSSYGGATGIGMSFFDAVSTWLKPNLVTVGSGDVDSSGIIIFLAGKKRFLTKNTTMLLHLAGRTLEQGKRFSTADLDAMLKEDKLKDYQYACVVSEACGGSHAPDEILEMMARNTLLTAQEAVRMGIAHAVLE